MRRFNLFFLLFIPFVSFGQFSENLKSDRPGQSLSPNTVGKKVLQIQTGYVYNRSEFSTYYTGNSDLSASSYSKQNYGDLQLRYGIFEKTELLAMTSLGFDQRTVNKSGRGTEDVNVVRYGFGIRQNFLNQEKHGFDLGMDLRYVEDDYMDVQEMIVSVAASKQVFEKLSLTANFGYKLEANMYMTVNAAYNFGQNFGMFLEFFPEFGSKQVLTTNEDFRLINTTINSGFYYALSPNFVLDVSGSFLTYDERENSESVDYKAEVEGYSLNIGLTARLDWRD